MFRALLIAATAAFLGSSASALTMQAVLSGHVEAIDDGMGVFGPAGSSLANAALSATFIYDTTMGRTTDATADHVSGSSTSGAAYPFSKAEFTLNGKTVAVAGSRFATVGIWNLDQHTSVYTLSVDDRGQGGSGYDQGGVHFSVVLAGNPVSLDTPFSFTPQPGFHAGGSFGFQTSSGGYIRDVSAFLRVTQLDVTSLDRFPAPVPLPASGAVLLAAVGTLAGAVGMRKRQSKI